MDSYDVLDHPIQRGKSEAVNRRRTCNIMDKIKRDKKMIYKTLHSKLKIEQHQCHNKLGPNQGAPEGLAVPAPIVIPVVLLFDDKNII